MSSLLTALLCEPPSPIAAENVSAWWAAWSRSSARRSHPIEDAIIGGLCADRLGFAFAAGYHAALRSLVPEVATDRLVALCATEQGGVHPRQLKTRLEPDGEGFWLSGHKRWSTLSPLADELLVVAVIGADDGGKRRLVIARVPRTAPGVLLRPMPETPFAPEIPHAEIELERVRVAESDLLAGDAWEDYVKPFRTVEDLHVHGALIGYLIGVARRHAFAEAEIENLAALAITTRALAAEPVRSAETHVAVAGLLDQTARALESLEPAWQRAGGADRARFERDRGLLAVAAGARSARKKRAWERLSGVEITATRS